jgi:hypothetical protein
MARTKKQAAETASAQTAIVAYKGFGLDWKCSDFQFEIGKTFKHKGKVRACEGGFHACEHPLNVFGYYAPATSRYALVELGGKVDRKGDDTKIAAAEITIKAELRIPELIAAAVKYVFDRATGWDTNHANGHQGAASATGTQGAASATGDQGAASATGTQGAASATGTQGAALATGHQGAASATGDQGAASATGFNGRAMGAEGNALFLVERIESYGYDHGKIIAAWAGIVGQDGIRPDTWYTLKGGKPVEVA